MPDLTLHEYRDFSKEKLKQVLKAEALKMFAADALREKKVVFSLSTCPDRRSGVERRQFSYDSYIPERRCGQDRRSSLDSRSDFDRRKSKKLLRPPDFKTEY